jgi:4-coumarate--CoA ligase
MSETTLAISFQKTIFKPGSVGELVPGQTLKVVDENGKMLGPNESGELLFKGSQRMMGYIGNEEATKFTIDQDGWLHTGDIGYFDNDKQFFIVDRLKELIKYKAFQVIFLQIFSK